MNAEFLWILDTRLGHKGTQVGFGSEVQILLPQYFKRDNGVRTLTGVVLSFSLECLFSHRMQNRAYPAGKAENFYRLRGQYTSAEVRAYRSYSVIIKDSPMPAAGDRRIPAYARSRNHFPAWSR
jgi:hypothetical protein